MHFRILISMIVTVVVLMTPVTEPRAESAPPFQDFTLENGLRVIMVQERKAPVVAVHLWYNVGATDEEDGATGLAHMLEHMMFQGTTMVGPGEYSQRIARMGGDDNAATSLDYTYYYVKVSSDRLQKVLELEADRMRNLVIDEEKFRSENMVVQEERRQRTDSRPSARLMERLRTVANGADHPYGRPVIGWMEDIRNHSVEEMRTFYRTHYRSDNAVLVIVGDLAFSPARRIIDETMGAVPAPKKPHTRAALSKPHFPDSLKTISLKDKRVTMRRLYRTYPVPTLVDPAFADDVYALDVLVTILGDGESSRLYRALVEKERLANGTDAGYGGISRQWEQFSIYANLVPGVPMKRVLAVVDQEVERLRNELVSEREYNKAINALLAGHVYGRDTVDNLAWAIGRLTVSGIDWRVTLNYPERVAQVTREDVRRVAQRYLRHDQGVLAYLLPADADDGGDQ
ncbi:MAG: insulinase family protein [Magnetococcales bacterium]|nr:insulinase family protein [Magnetococcales bacterium]